MRAFAARSRPAARSAFARATWAAIVADSPRAPGVEHCLLGEAMSRTGPERAEKIQQHSSNALLTQEHQACHAYSEAQGPRHDA
jgi:hypothetical protein